MAAVDSDTVAELTTLLPGQVLTAADDAYEAALSSAVWNGAIRRQPGVIAQPRTAAEVADVVRACRGAPRISRCVVVDTISLAMPWPSAE